MFSNERLQIILKNNGWRYLRSWFRMLKRYLKYCYLRCLHKPFPTIKTVGERYKINPWKFPKNRLSVLVKIK